MLLTTANTQPAVAQRVGMRPGTVDLSNYVGGDQCALCHADVQEVFQKNPHYKTWNDTELDWSQRGCEACHGPGREHIEAGGDATLIFNFKNISPQEASDRCLSCHLGQENQANFLRSDHGANAVSCLECHSVHNPKVRSPLLVADQPALCYTCHAEVKPEFNKPFHHKIHEGLMDCSDCHNQHGGFNASQLRDATGNDYACYTCHADKQGPFVFEHVPIKVEGCQLCHSPHGSNYPRMLKRPEVHLLCLDCHSDTVGVLGPRTPSFHNMGVASYRQCTICHVNIHGSNLNHLFFE